VARLGAERAGGALLALGERLEARERELAAAREALAEAEHRLVQAFGEGARAEAERAVATVTGEESTLTARLAALRQARGELGPVWAGAGEAHAEAARRLGAVDDELAGLEAARQALMALAEQARRRMDRAVAETLGAVRQGFVAAVAELLEGRGEVLEAGGDGAEAGLELRIALPGKRTAALAALSGGERALGALAFLFALLAVRPSALVLLDEVEAALDPANVGRFARHLRRTAATQQFLVITHQRATMEAAHALWGFTAQEAGASHLVTVRLDDAPAEEDTEGVAG
jgi:chromosome segregation protein